MITDRRPARDTLRREYDSSHCLEKIRAPASPNLAPLFGALEAARDAAAPKLMKNVCTRVLASLSAFYGIPSPSLKLLGPRPHSTHEGRLANELFGDYDIKGAKIRLWTRTPMKKQWTSSKTILSTLCHEFMHHLDVTLLGFPNSFHTVGFYERTHRLYLTALGHPYYPLKWRRVGFEGRQTIDWQVTRRLGARLLSRTKMRAHKASGPEWRVGGRTRPTA
jgi:WLM domain